MKKSRDIVIGLIIIALGVVFGLKTFGIADIDIFFDGWWTLFIIVPSIVNIFKSDNKINSALALAIGVLLLLMAQGLVSLKTLVKVAVPIIIIAIGIKFVFSGVKKTKTASAQYQTFVGSGETFNTSAENNSSTNSAHKKIHTVIFGGDDLNFSNEIFDGGRYTAVFGGIDCDLRNAIIEKDVTIEANAVFGGVDVYLPSYVNVKVSSNSIFGGVDSKEHINNPQNQITVNIIGTALFGGVDIK